MSYPELPDSVKTMLADPEMRTHHRLWHMVRNQDVWDSLPSTARLQLETEGWKPPRFEHETGAGLDFLGMHREMIEMTNAALQSANDPNWPVVEGWDPIPWSDTDADWPVPDWETDRPVWANASQWDEFTTIADWARSQNAINDMQDAAVEFTSSSYLQSVSLDRMGKEIETTIHGWMHIRWSGAPHPVSQHSADVSNDWLFLPWSSHVNKVFWKLHGWIDARIDNWAQANSTVADLSTAWSGPHPEMTPSMPMMHHRAPLELLTNLEFLDGSEIPMKLDRQLVEEVVQRHRQR